jgi:hypothetical protein
MHPRRMVLGLGLIGALAVPRASAQESSVEIGSRIRFFLDLSVPKRITGAVITLESDTLRLVPERRTDTISVPMGSIRRVELHRRRSAAGGAVFGGAIGMTLGGTAMLAIAAAGHCLSFDFSSYSPTHCPSDRTAMAVIFGPAVAGAIIGSVVRGERWVRVHLPRVQASLGPSGVRVAIGF